jgi:hypothetical protein
MFGWDQEVVVTALRGGGAETSDGVILKERAKRASRRMATGTELASIPRFRGDGLFETTARSGERSLRMTVVFVAR